MKTLPDTATTSPRADSGKARVYEFRDFVALKRETLYVQVHQCRTVYHANGRISRDFLPAITLLEQMVHAFHGKIYQSAGTLNAFFDDPEQARECARAISAYHGRMVQLCGTQISIEL